VAEATARLVAGFILLVALLFLPAGTLAWWQAWLYIATLFIPVTAAVVYLAARDPALLERRLRTKEKQAPQARLMILAAACYLLLFVVAGLDERFAWSRVPAGIVVGADALMLLAYGLFMRVLRENPHAGRTIEVEAGQRVVATGPYALVRHPMYVAAIAMMLVAAPALGSWWALLPALLQTGVIIARIRGEEALLLRELPGYDAYLRRTRYRLIPHVW
jgi:protein-S-isoprenylcysteine O-methyltransferase Ste14